MRTLNLLTPFLCLLIFGCSDTLAPTDDEDPPVEADGVLYVKYSEITRLGSLWLADDEQVEVELMGDVGALVAYGHAVVAGDDTSTASLDTFRVVTTDGTDLITTRAEFLLQQSPYNVQRPGVSPKGDAIAVPHGVSFDNTRGVVNNELWLYGPDGTVKMPQNIAHEAMPAFSPDGSEVAYFTRGDELVVANVNGSTLRTVTTVGMVVNDYFTGLTWSTDGSRLAFTASPDDTKFDWHLFVVPSAGGSKVDLGTGFYPSFSPDGSTLAYSEEDGRISLLDAATIESGNPVQIKALHVEGAFCAYPQWSPDGKRLLCVALAEGPGDGNLGSLVIFDVEAGTHTLFSQNVLSATWAR